MICDQLADLIGVSCTPMDDQGAVALVETPFRFADGNAFPVYAEATERQVRFFDAGGVAWHFAGRGLALGDERRVRFLKHIAERHAVGVSDHLELEVWADRAGAPDAFGRFVCALLACAEWERQNEGADFDAAGLLDDVAQALMATRPGRSLEREVPLTGISRQTHRMDFVVGGAEVVLAVTPHHASVSSAIRRLLDVKNFPENNRYAWQVVIDDRYDGEGARKEGMVLATVADVIMFGNLQAQAARLRGLH